MSGIKHTAAGRHFLQIPGPGNAPDSVLKAISKPIIDHRGPEFGELTLKLLEGLRWIFQTKNPVIIYPSSGTGAWEAALANTLNMGDKILAYETGHFAALWKGVAERMGFEVHWIESDWRSGIKADRIKEALTDDKNQSIKAVMVVHNETSTGTTSNIEAVRKVLDELAHPALLLVDVVSSLGTCEYKHDAWGVDVAVCASQKGLMLPPGLGFNALSSKSLKAYETSAFPKAYWDWGKIIQMNEKGFYPYTPSTNLLFGLEESLELLQKEGLEQIFKRHSLLAGGVRKAVNHWGLENFCIDPDAFSASTTAIMMPAEVDADEFRHRILENYNMSLGTGLGKLKGKVFRVGHLGHTNELTILGVLAGLEMGLLDAGIGIHKGGVSQAMDYFLNHPS